MKQCLYCQDIIKDRNRNAFYCSDRCGHLYRKIEVNPKPIKKNKGCKYCKNSDHIGFCCAEHKRIYKEIMRNIKIAKSKPKRKPTQAQLKQYQKLENFLNRPL